MSKTKYSNTKDAENKPKVKWTDLSQEQKDQLIFLSHLSKEFSRYASLPKIAQVFGTSRQNLEKYDSYIKKEGRYGK